MISMIFAAVICDADDPCSVNAADDPESSQCHLGARFLKARNRTRLIVLSHAHVRQMCAVRWVTGKMRKICVRQGLLSSPPDACTTFAGVYAAQC